MLQSKIQASKNKGDGTIFMPLPLACFVKNRTVPLFLSFILCFGICHFSYAQEQFVYDSKGKRGPFIPLVTPDGRLINLDKEEGVTGGLLLEGIMYDKHGICYAIVNGKVVKVGDEVAGYQILKIEEEKVIFIKEGQPTEVELKKEGP